MTSEIVTLDEELQNIEKALYESAFQRLQNNPDIGSYTRPQVMAMTKFEMLRDTAKIEYANLLIRGKIIAEIEASSLYLEHPEQFSTMEEAAQAYGISRSTLSKIRDMYGVIFPYLESKLMDPYQVYQEIGSSNFQELTGPLKVVITGQPSKSDQVMSAVEAVQDDIALTEKASGQKLDDDEKQELAVGMILNAGKQTNREMRKQLRPSHTPNIEPIFFRRNGDTYMLVHLTSDQELMVNRSLGDHMDAVSVDLKDTRMKQMLRWPLVKHLLGE